MIRCQDSESLEAGRTDQCPAEATHAYSSVGPRNGRPHGPNCSRFALCGRHARGWARILRGTPTSHDIRPLTAADRRFYESPAGSSLNRGVPL